MTWSGNVLGIWNRTYVGETCRYMAFRQMSDSVWHLTELAQLMNHILILFRTNCTMLSRPHLNFCQSFRTISCLMQLHCNGITMSFLMEMCNCRSYSYSCSCSYSRSYSYSCSYSCSCCYSHCCYHRYCCCLPHSSSSPQTQPCGSGVLWYEVLWCCGMRCCGAVVLWYEVLWYEVLWCCGMRCCGAVVWGAVVLWYEVLWCCSMS